MFSAEVMQKAGGVTGKTHCSIVLVVGAGGGQRQRMSCLGLRSLVLTTEHLYLLYPAFQVLGNCFDDAGPGAGFSF